MSIISTWNPNSNTITGITNSNPGVVTTATDHGYLSGLFVRIVFPMSLWQTLFGMPEVNGNVYQIEVLSPTTFAIDVDTTNFSPFTLNSTRQVPQVIPVGEQAASLLQAERNTLTPVGG